MALISPAVGHAQLLQTQRNLHNAGDNSTHTNKKLQPNDTVLIQLRKYQPIFIVYAIRRSPLIDKSKVKHQKGKPAAFQKEMFRRSNVCRSLQASSLIHHHRAHVPSELTTSIQIHFLLVYLADSSRVYVWDDVLFPLKWPAFAWLLIYLK